MSNTTNKSDVKSTPKKVAFTPVNIITFERNVTMYVDEKDNIWMKVDSGKTLDPSSPMSWTKSYKNLSTGTTGGKQIVPIPGRNIYAQLNVYETPQGSLMQVANLIQNEITLMKQKGLTPVILRSHLEEALRQVQ